MPSPNNVHRYCGADGGGGGPGDDSATATGYKEYDRSVCLQVGRGLGCLDAAQRGGWDGDPDEGIMTLHEAATVRTALDTRVRLLRRV